MGHVQSLSHTKWECKYHVVWIPKYRKKSLYVELRKYLGSTFKDLAMQKECQVIEGHLLSDHIHLLISIPPKYSVSQTIGYLKGRRNWGKLGDTSHINCCSFALFISM